MRMELVVGIACLLFMSMAVASEPGQPLDCSDWVFTAPGYSCSQICCNISIGASCGDHADEGTCLDLRGAVSKAADAAGRIVTLRIDPPFTTCGSKQALRYLVTSSDGTTSAPVGYISERCLDPSLSTIQAIRLDSDPSPPGGAFRFVFDLVNGRLLIPFQTQCEEPPYQYNCSGYPLSLQNWGFFVIDGFPKAFDIFQTYTPPAGPWSFRVPAMPDGLGGAEHFDTYYGPLTKPLDFTQAQPLQCDYPDSPPRAGDYLTVPDPLPNPPAGTGRYYVTAATYQGQTRYGRRASGGRLSGRDPALLPACVQPETK